MRETIRASIEEMRTSTEVTPSLPIRARMQNLYRVVSPIDGIKMRGCWWKPTGCARIYALLFCAGI